MSFLYGFVKAVRRAARAANSARSPQLPLALPLRRRLAPVGWRKKNRKPRTAIGFTAVTQVQLSDWSAGIGSYREQVCSPNAVLAGI